MPALSGSSKQPVFKAQQKSISLFMSGSKVIATDVKPWTHIVTKYWGAVRSIDFKNSDFRHQ